jgi:hypothetical protein
MFGRTPASENGAVPDVLPPGHKSVRHELCLEIDATLDGWTLVAFPTRGFSTAHVITAGVPFGFSTKYGTRIYFLPAGVDWPAGDEVDGSFEAKYGLPVPCAATTSVPAGSPLGRIESHYEVRLLGSRPVFEPRGELHFDSRGAPVDAVDLWPWLLAVAALGGCGLGFEVRRRRATADTGAEA